MPETTDEKLPITPSRLTGWVGVAALSILSGGLLVSPVMTVTGNSAPAEQVVAATGHQPELVGVYEPVDSTPKTLIASPASASKPAAAPKNILPSVPFTDVILATDSVRGNASCPDDASLPTGNMQPNGIAVMRCAKFLFPGIKEIGGWRANGGVSPDHPNGVAVDMMTDLIGQSTSEGKAVGDKVAAYFQQHANDFGVTYIIWQQRIWNASVDAPDLPLSSWRLMSDRGSITDNHMDHVHVSVKPGSPVVSVAYSNNGTQAWPVPGHKDGSPAGMRFHPILHYMKCHEGTDIGAPTGTPIVAFRAGTVTAAGESGGYGNRVELDHGNGLTSRYGHMSSIGVSAGQSVKVGQVIGYVGSTGLSTGPHLHFEVRQDGTVMNPMGWFGGQQRTAC